MNLSKLLSQRDHKDHLVRMDVAIALGNSGDPRAIAPLIKMLDDPSFPVWRDAAKGLAKLGHGRAAGPLLNRARRETESTGILVGAIEDLLTKASSTIPEPILHEMVGLTGLMESDERYIEDFGEWRSIGHSPVNCEKIQRLARQELGRRGRPAS